MKKPVRLLVYVGILALSWFVLAPALTINAAQIGAPIKQLIGGWSTAAVAGLTVLIALGITYLITSGWGLVLLGALAFCGLVILAILHPYLFPLLIPLAALWVACAVARRKETASNEH